MKGIKIKRFYFLRFSFVTLRNEQDLRTAVGMVMAFGDGVGAKSPQKLAAVQDHKYLVTL